MKQNIFKYLFFKIYSIVLLFLLIFSPIIPFFYNGTLFALILSLPYIILNDESKNCLIWFLRQKIIKYIIYAPIVLVFISIFFSIIHLTFDFTIVKTLINQSLTALVIVIVLSIILKKDTDLKSIHLLLWIVFLMQSVIIFAAFIIEDFRVFIRMFQPESFRHMDDYRGGIRTLTVSSTGFFGLGCTYGLLYILYLKFLIDNKLKSVSYIILFLIFVISTFFIARTGFIGLFFAFILFILDKNKRIVNLFTTSVKIIFTICLFLVVVLLFVDNIILDTFNQYVIPYAFEMFNGDSGGVETTSTDTLLGMFNNKISIFDFIVGTGNYTNMDGSYFRETDVGYLRLLLFGGLMYLLLFIIHQLIIIFQLVKYSNNYNIDRFKFSLLLLLFSLILNLKGEVIGFLIPFLTLIYLYFIPIFYYTYFKIKD
jgi:hypothetical protein